MNTDTIEFIVAHVQNYSEDLENTQSWQFRFFLRNLPNNDLSFWRPSKFSKELFERFSQVSSGKYWRPDKASELLITFFAKFSFRREIQAEMSSMWLTSLLLMSKLVRSAIGVSKRLEIKAGVNFILQWKARQDKTRRDATELHSEKNRWFACPLVTC